jgi:hypothetical protein
MTPADPRAEIRAALKCLAKAAKIEDAEWSYPDGFSGTRGGDFLRWASRILSAALAALDHQAQEIQRMREALQTLRSAQGEIVPVLNDEVFRASWVVGVASKALQAERSGEEG